MNMSYHLRSVLVGHTEDVRCSTVLSSLQKESSQDVIVTGSRDKSIRVWECSTQDACECSSGAIMGHSDYVTALCSLEGLEAGAFVSGSRDATLRLWRRKQGTEYQSSSVLEGHQYQVTGVVGLHGEDGCAFVVSTSLDKSVRLWKAGTEGVSCCDTKNEHDGPVLSVCACSDDCIVTGSGDCTMRLWSVGNGSLSCTSVIRGHTDTVRSVAHVPNIGIVSGSHDSTVKLWTLDGQCLQTFEGHEALIYSVAVNNDGTLIASASEDCTVRVWNMGGECLGVIKHPGCVWSVAFLSQGDLVSGCADGVARIWSADSSRKASDDAIAAFEAHVQLYHEKSKAKQGDDGEGQKLELQSPAALQQPGTQDGQTIVVDEGANGMAYSWNAQAGDWEKIGEVLVDGAGGGWDFSFDVDIADGQPKIKLQANAGEDAYVVADRFIAQNNLPTSYKEQIVQFLITNTQGQVNINLDTSGSFVDPYTGASAYVPGNSSQGVASSIPSLGENVDPFTGSRGQSSGKFPVKDYVVFSSPLSVDNAMKKLQEFHEDISSQQQELTVSPEGWKSIESLMNQASKDTIEYSDEAASAVNTILSWPCDKVFPLLDLFRALLLSSGGRDVLKKSIEGICSTPTQGTLGYVVNELVKNPQSGPGAIASLRVLANAFHTETIPHIAGNMDYIVELVDRCKDCPTKGVQNAYTALLLNMTVYFQKITNPSPSTAMKIATQVSHFISLFENGPNSTALVHALLAIGTLRRESLIKPADLSRLLPSSIMNTISQRSGEESLIVKEIQSL